MADDYKAQIKIKDVVFGSYTADIVGESPFDIIHNIRSKKELMEGINENAILTITHIPSDTSVKSKVDWEAVDEDDFLCPRFKKEEEIEKWYEEHRTPKQAPSFGIVPK